MGNLIEIDGSFGEGGGQILRTSLSLSMVTGKSIVIRNIRAGRKKPGLQRQHLTAVNAAREISGAEVNGNNIGSMELYFAPDIINHGRYHFDVGSAGSCTLVFQTILPALITANGDSEVILRGGTHNPFAPPFDFLEKTFVPILNRMDSEITVKLDRPGFFPAGGGIIIANIKPAKELTGINLHDRGRIKQKRARALVARLPRNIADRELKVIQETLSTTPDCMRVEEITSSRGPGNVVIVEIESEHITEVFTGFGIKGIRAEQVAERTADEVRKYLAADVPVGKHLADQLLIPMALAGGGEIRTFTPTEHTITNIEILKRFLDIEFTVSVADNGVTIISVQCS